MYRTLGFEPMDEAEGGVTRWQLGLGEFVPRSVPMQVEQAGAVIEEAAAVGV
jgi:hypothetical protein